MTDFERLETPIAKKEHRCEWCVSPIEIGKKYQKFTGVFDAHFYTGRWHKECREAMSRNTEDWYDSYCPEGNHEIGGDCNH